MTPEEQARLEKEREAAAGQREKINARRDERRASPEQQDEAKLRAMIDAAVDARMARLVIQSGHGINVTGGNGNYTVAFDSSAISWNATGACLGDGSFQITITGG